MRDKITKLFEEVGKDYQSKKFAELELYQGHDVHAFYRLLSDPSKVIHVQGYPGMSDENQARVFARMMDYNTMMIIRNRGNVSIGNEHEAVIRPFGGLELGKMIPYKPEVLETILEEYCPELK